MTEQPTNMQSKQVIAKIFGVTTRQIEYLQKNGIIKGEGKPSKFDLFPTIQAYIKYLEARAKGKEKNEKDGKNESAKIEADAKLKKSKAEIAELQLKELKGELHRAKDVEDIMTDHVLMIRSLLMGMPNKLAVDLAETNNAAEVSERIREEVYFILNELVNYEYNADEFKKRVRERNKWQSDEPADDE